MHSKGEPKIPHTGEQYPDILAELESFFESRIALAISAGLPRDAIVLDPGMDFAKQPADSLRIFRGLARLRRLGRPILLPASRKSTIGRVLGIENPAERDAGTVACLVAGTLRGASILRVHNVRAAWQTLRTLEAMR
jgi:dihydropteroate synthase